MTDAITTLHLLATSWDSRIEERFPLSALRRESWPELTLAHRALADIEKWNQKVPVDLLDTLKIQFLNTQMRLRVPLVHIITRLDKIYHKANHFEAAALPQGILFQNNKVVLEPKFYENASNKEIVELVKYLKANEVEVEEIVNLEKCIRIDSVALSLVIEELPSLRYELIEHDATEYLIKFLDKILEIITVDSDVLTPVSLRNKFFHMVNGIANSTTSSHLELKQKLQGKAQSLGDKVKIQSFTQIIELCEQIKRVIFLAQREPLLVMKDCIIIKKEHSFGIILNRFLKQLDPNISIKHFYAIENGRLEELSFKRMKFLVSKKEIISVNDCFESQIIKLKRAIPYKVDGVTWKALFSDASDLGEDQVLDLTPACFEQVMDLLYSMSPEDSKVLLTNNYDICINTFKVALHFQMKELIHKCFSKLKAHLENYPVLVADDLLSVIDRWSLFMRIESPYKNEFIDCFELKLNTCLVNFNQEDKERICNYFTKFLGFMEGKR